MSTEQLHELTASQMKQALMANKVTSEQLVLACLTQIEINNPKLNAVFQVQKEEAIEQARLADKALKSGKAVGALHGIPFTIKDLFETKDVVTTAGSVMFKDYSPVEDATIVKRLKAAGAILIGKTNTPELALSDECNSPVYGRTNNPYDLTRTPGGSSGGAAAAIAARMIPFDLGSDIGGSVRLPAHFCGICALKPTHGRIPTTGHIPSYGDAFSQFNHVGPMARSVDDLELLLSVLNGPDWKDPLAHDVPLLSSKEVNVSGLRIGYYTDDNLVKVPAPFKAAVNKAVEALKQVGCSTSHQLPEQVQFGGEILVEHFLYDGSKHLRDFVNANKPELMGEELKAWLSLGTDATVEDAQRANSRLAELRNGMIKVFEHADVLIAPVAPVVAFKHGAADGTADSSMMQAYNLNGWPVASIPVALSEEGMPIGIQIIGRPWKDEEVLAVARTIERSLGEFPAPVIS
ncbi:amidase [Vibrio hangzhouensis]|uniref:amidase n=1 Tax=Vibrio hangzhouensis TaxID=462991 RepID=UPI001C95C9ED|nr:amidase [Vibrio hangzhouensis]MBY6199259.1 amidase [Vibrio hangzhouensis]